MPALWAEIQRREPALLTALLTLVGGFVAQAGPGHIPSLRALGTSVTVSGIQGLLTREYVVSPASAAAGTSGVDPRSPTPWLVHGAEPALAMSVVGLLSGFLVQLVGSSVDLLQALGISAGLAGTQGAITRQQVNSPRSIAMNSLSTQAGLGAMPLAGVPAGASVAVAGPTTPAPSQPAASAVVATPAAAVSPGATHPDPTADPALLSLLQRYRPMVRYDSLESFYADSAAVITDRPGNLLKRQDGTVIAAATPDASTSQLVLAFLQPQVYPNGEAVASTDYLQEVGADYVEQAREMHARPGYADLIHGHVAVDSTGTRWLQYWLFMYYDDPGFLGFGTHEGDIEMIQVRLDENDQPTAASYSQHRTGVRADWSQLELASSPDGPVPVAYSARGSHANLLRAGDQISLRSFLPDHNDGGGYRVRPELVVLSESQTPWCVWPGAWGSTRASGPLGDAGIYANSPAALTNHRAWSDPSGFHESCSPPDDLPPAGAPTAVDQPSPPAPQLSVLPSATATVAQFTLPSQVTVASPEKVVVGLASPAAGVPAITATVDVRGPTGVVELPLPPGGAPLELRATTHAANGLASPTTTVTL